MHALRSGLSLLATLLVGGTIAAGAAHADPVKCRAAIGKSGAAFAQVKMKALQKCWDGRVKKGFPTTLCPDQKTDQKIAAARSKAKSAIAKACGGKDKVCGTGGDDTLAAIGFPTTCPNFESLAVGCDAAVADCNGIGVCLTCIDGSAVDQAIGLYYGSLNSSDPKADKALNKCQLAIGKSAAALFAAKSKALQKCWGVENKNGAKGQPTTACPPFGTGDGKAASAIAKAKQKADGAICKACGGTGKPCDLAAATLTAAMVGFPHDCPPVTVPGTTTQPCAATVTTLGDVRACVDCVTEFKADCVSLAAARGFPSAPAYPAECNPVLPATPTRTPTPTVTPTPGAVPTGVKRVFVTSTTHDGSIGETFGGDMLCANRASAAGLTGTFKSWFSVTGDGPAQRFTQSALPYGLIDGTLIANNWSDLVDGTLAHAIDQDENGSAVAASDVWTATDTAGNKTTPANPSGTDNCNEWLSNAAVVPGVHGNSAQTNGNWANAGTTTCDTQLRLYCFEQ